MKLTQDELDYIHEVVERPYLEKMNSQVVSDSQQRNKIQGLLAQLLMFDPLSLLLSHDQHVALQSFDANSLLKLFTRDIPHKLLHEANENEMALLTLIDQLPNIIDDHGFPRNWRFHPSPKISMKLASNSDSPKLTFTVDSLSLSGACVITFPLNSYMCVELFLHGHACLELTCGLEINIQVERAVSRAKHQVALEFSQATRDNPVLKLLILSQYVKSRSQAPDL
ncbi:hypothetical protein [Pseudoalteromonas luteoviolacea]|uniref:Uncharacterized protein n=1 Tax=Pseudoalteromonas luteoviolacea S4060-1 TaxID=1365257 RepID=A0A162B1N9_9GAMM|nr:hypothetical protein [Pseudoalteromonas luteoviolacea]KZN65043.1 hypothetical protein N478_03275 [Pseudoalteromonas luteoviolacea S4060-1]